MASLSSLQLQKVGKTRWGTARRLGTPHPSFTPKTCFYRSGILWIRAWGISTSILHFCTVSSRAGIGTSDQVSGGGVGLSL